MKSGLPYKASTSHVHIHSTKSDPSRSCMSLPRVTRLWCELLVAYGMSSVHSSVYVDDQSTTNHREGVLGHCTT